MLKLIKNLYLFITISIVFVGLAVITFFPFLFPMIAIYQRPSGVERPFLIKFDLFNPTYGILADPTDTSDIVPSPEVGFTVVKFKRKNVIFFEPDEILLTGKFNYETKLYARDILRERNFTKTSQIPKNMIISFSKNNIEDDTSSTIPRTEEDRYFDDIQQNTKITGRSKIDIQDFKVLKIGEKEENIRNTLGPADKGVCPGIITKLCEKQYKFSEDSKINFVALAFEDTDNEFPDPEAKLQKIIIVKKDRTFIEVPTKPDGTFDLDNYAH